MPPFKYTAKKGPDEYLSGEMDAESAGIVQARLKEEGLFPLSIDEAGIESAGDHFCFRWGRKASSQDLAMFARQLGNLVAAGLPILSSLDTLSDQTENRAVCRAIRRLAEAIRKGSALAQALAHQADIFPAVFAASVRAGETGGTLDKVLHTLADHYETEDELWSSVKGAMIYPAFLAFIGTITVYVLLSFVIPNFIELFNEFGAALPLPTVILIGVSSFMARYWWTAPIILVVAGILTVQYYKTDHGRLHLDRLRLQAPLLGKLVHKTEIAKFARTLGMLLESGVSAIEAMDIAADTLRNQAIVVQVRKARDTVSLGKRIADALAEAQYFPKMLSSLVSVGEQTGDLAGVFGRAADIYEKEVQRYTQVLAKMLEPTMIVVVGGAVGFIVIATLLPVFQISAMVR